MSNDGSEIQSIQQSVQPDTADEQGTPGNDPADGATEQQRVPLDRFRQVTSENKELREQLDQLAKWKEEQEQAQLTGA
jgi:hypothetical protein